MYNPKPFPVKDRAKLVDFARKHNFGYLISSLENIPRISTIPFLINDGFTRIRGHIALANQNWKGLEGKGAMVFFPGPQHYISPGWYEEEHAVPTWNYANVSASGIFHLVEDDQHKMEILDDLSTYHESQIGGSWIADWTDNEYKAMLRSIVAFEIEVEKVEGKWKMSQNHPREKCMNVIDKLRGLGSKESIEMAGLMESLWN